MSGPRQLSAAAWVTALSLITLLIRAAIANRGGVWADEAFFLLVANSSSWHSMLGFLELHESHPPLFYAIARVWISLFGNQDATVRILPVVLGTMIVPATYATGRKLFSGRVGLIAAGLTAVSSSLAEHSSQLRPYALLSLLCLVSCFSMVELLTTRRARSWIIYVTSTVLLVYTHNWAWLIVSGQQVAAFTAMWRESPPDRRDGLKLWLRAWAVILIAYAPWVSTLQYQAVHAGHSGIPLHGLRGLVEFVAYGVFTSLQTLFFGRLDTPATASLVGFVAAILALLISFRRPRRAIRETDHRAETSSTGLAVWMLSATVMSTLGIAVVLSHFSNQLLPRCIATLIPVVVLAIAGKLYATFSTSAPQRATLMLASGLAAFLAGVNAVGLFAVSTTPRSNAREVADFIRARALPSDLVVVAPEWFAASFNRYFPASVEQVDYPHDGRSGLVDFSNVWERVTDARPLEKLNLRLSEAEHANRRVWFVSESKYLKNITEEEIQSAARDKDRGMYSTLRVNQIRATLGNLYGAPDSAVLGHSRPSYDDLKAYLYTRRDNVRDPGR